MFKALVEATRVAFCTTAAKVGGDLENNGTVWNHALVNVKQCKSLKLPLISFFLLGKWEIVIVVH